MQHLHKRISAETLTGPSAILNDRAGDGTTSENPKPHKRETGSQSIGNGVVSRAK